MESQFQIPDTRMSFRHTGMDLMTLATPIPYQTLAMPIPYQILLTPIYWQVTLIMEPLVVAVITLDFVHSQLMEQVRLMLNLFVLVIIIVSQQLEQALVSTPLELGLVFMPLVPVLQ
jgi:hypothetical protein